MLLSKAPQGLADVLLQHPGHSAGDWEVKALGFRSFEDEALVMGLRPKGAFFALGLELLGQFFGGLNEAKCSWARPRPSTAPKYKKV